MRLEPAAVSPSTAKKALVMATAILLASKGVTVPLRRMTLMSPGAVFAISKMGVWSNVRRGCLDVHGVFLHGIK